jgi:uncharacterized protein YndB with AHSA1/START domain
MAALGLTDETLGRREVIVAADIRAAPEEVWSALTDQDQVVRWAADGALIDGRVGGFYSIWGNKVYGAPQGPSPEARVLVWKPPMQMAYRTPIGDYLATACVEIERYEGGSRVLLRLRGLPGLGTTSGAAMSNGLLETMFTLHLRYLLDYLELGLVGPQFDYGAAAAATIRQTVETTVTQEEVWDALTAPGLLDRWIAAGAEVDLRVGGKYRYGWAQAAVGPTVITGLAPPYRLQTDWWERGGVSQVTWTVGERSLTVTHSGLVPDPGLIAEYSVGWFDFLYALWSLLARQRLASRVGSHRSWAPPRAPGVTP